MAAFAGYDAMALPTIYLPACSILEGGPNLVRQRSRNTPPFNALGLPAICLPCGLARNGLSMSLKTVGQPLAQATALSLARAYGQAIS